jgi:4-oxalocrotonate tautomerase
MEQIPGQKYLNHSPPLTPLSPSRGEGKGEGHRKELSMPIVHINMIAGRTPEKKEKLIKKVTEAIVEALEIPADRVHIILHDIPKENIGHGGVPLSKADL